MSQIQHEQAPPAEYYTDMTVGEILRKTREYYGQSLPYVESVLRIRASQLEALETGNLDILPGRVYAIGFVRSYAEYLGLDGDQMVHLFKLQTQGRAKRPELHFPVAASESKAPGLAAVTGSLLGIVALFGIWAIFQTVQRGPDLPIPPVPEELAQSEITEAPAIGASPDEAALLETVSEIPQVPQAPALPENRIILEITEQSWIEIKNREGGTLLRRVLEPGDQYLVPDESGLVMSTGNAGGFKIRVDGEYLFLLGQTGDVRRNIPLDPDVFLQQR